MAEATDDENVFYLGLKAEAQQCLYEKRKFLALGDYTQKKNSDAVDPFGMYGNKSIIILCYEYFQKVSRCNRPGRKIRC